MVNDSECEEDLLSPMAASLFFTILLPPNNEPNPFESEKTHGRAGEDGGSCVA